MKCPKCGAAGAVKNGSGRGTCRAGGHSFQLEPKRIIEEEKQAMFAVTRERDQLRLENRRLLQESADLAVIKKMIGHISANISNPPAFLSKPSKPRAKVVHGRPNMMLSDLHFGAVVNPSQVNGVNQYSTDIAKKRIRYVTGSAVEFLRTALSPGDFGGVFTLNLGGDMVDGIIHDELRENADQTVLEQMITLHDELVPIIKMFANEFGHCHVNCVAGNHGRLDKKPRFYNAAQLNLDWALYRFLAKVVLADKKYEKRVSFTIPDGLDCRYAIYKTRYLLNHGDKMKGGDGWSGVLLPWMRGETKKSRQYNAISLPFDHLVIGHFHQAVFLDRIFGNGCLIGYDPYAQQNGYSFEPPQQILWLTHPVFGAIHKTEIFAEEQKKK